MSDEKMVYVFGPVPSRRLGRSLGVDLIPPKTCTLNCVYCQIGRTTELSIQRREFVPIGDVIEQIAQALRTKTRPDYITLAGSGEPTLYSRLGELIDRIHAITDIPVDVITNGVLLADPQVRDELGKADLIIPSLDAADEETFIQINRPAHGIVFDEFLDGLRIFCNDHGRKVWLEVFIVNGMNDTDEKVEAIAKIASKLDVAQVHLNTAVRPPAESHVKSLKLLRMYHLAGLFDPSAKVIADFEKHKTTGQFDASKQSVLDTLRRRPCTLEDLASGLDVKTDEIEKILEKLLGDGRIIREERNERTYYIACG